MESFLNFMAVDVEPGTRRIIVSHRVFARRNGMSRPPRVVPRSRFASVTQHFQSLVRSFRQIVPTVLTVLITIVAVASPEVRGAEVTVSRLIVGVGGGGRVGSWVPVRVTASGLASSSPVRLVVTASDAKGDDCVNVVASGTADSTGAIQLEGVFPPGRLDGTVLVELRNEKDEIVWNHPLTLAADSMSIGAANAETADRTLPTTLQLVRHVPLTVMTVGQTSGLTELTSIYEARDATRGTLAHFFASSFDDLPETRRGYDSFDVIVMNSAYDLNEAQALAVQGWVMAGGQLIVSGGDSLPEMLSSPTGPWLKSLFGIQDNVIRSQDLSALQNFVIGANQLQTNRKDVSIIRVSSKQSAAIVDSINGPIISRNTAGVGVVTLVSADMNQEPIRSWLSLPQLYEMLLFGRLSANAEEQFSQRQMISSTGVTDLATQLAAVSDAIPPGERWTSWHAMLLMVIFLAMIGPLDYLLVVKLLRRPRMTWFTFPAMIVLACGLTWWKSDSGRPQEVARAVHLLDVGQTDSRQIVHIRSWSSLSTKDSRFARVSPNRLEFLTGLTLQPLDKSLSWHGRAEDVFGGLYRPGGAGLGKVSSRRVDGEAAAFENIPLLADGSQSFVAEFVDDADGPGVFDSKLRTGPGGLLEGSIVHRLNAPIRNWIIAFGSRIYLPMKTFDEAATEIPPNTEWTRESSKVKISEIRDFLKGVRAVERIGPKQMGSDSNMTQVQTPYDSNGTDPQDILTMISLFQIAGGESYVKLSNNSLRRDELSDSISLNTAMLIGVIDLPLTELVVDEKPVPATKSQTVVRFMLPVSRPGE